MKNIENKKKIVYTKNGTKCIGPCYPPNTILYNPYNLCMTIESEPTCAIKPKKVKIGVDEIVDNFETCDVEDIDYNYKNFNILNDDVLLFGDDNIFLDYVYDISNLQNLKFYLLNSFSDLPVYTQRRLLRSMFIVYYDFVDFPKKIFIEKIKFVLDEIYKIKLSSSIIFEDLDLIDNKNKLFGYFANKYCQNA